MKIIDNALRKKETMIINSDEVLQIIKQYGFDNFMLDTIDAVEQGFIDFKKGAINVPKRHGLYLENGLVESMPVQDKDFICFKIGSVYKKNNEKNLPSTLAHLVMLDKQTGYPVAIIEDTLITAIRTGAASAVATLHLAQPYHKTIGIIGTGTQAYTQLHALALITDGVPDVLVYDKDESKARQFHNGYRDLNIEGSYLNIIPAPLKDIINLSDIIVTSTSKTDDEEPVIKFEDFGLDAYLFGNTFNRDLHINAIGTDIPKPGAYTEIDKKALKKSKVIVDHMEQALAEGESQNLKKHQVYSDLGDIILGNKNGKDKCKYDVTIYDSTGVAFQDLVTAKLILDKMQTSQRFTYQKEVVNPYLIK